MILIENLKSDLSLDDLLNNLHHRLRNFFIIDESESELIKSVHMPVLNRVRTCFSGVDNKYFNSDGIAYFSYTHSGQYLAYLYFFSLEFSLMNHPLKDKFYYLNKIMHGVDIYSEVRLPEVFFFEHPIGLILGRATYGNNFFAMQGCTVGGNKGHYPTIGNNVKMYSDSKILGNSNIGDNVLLSANTYIKDTNIPSNSIVFGQSPNLIIKDIKK